MRERDPHHRVKAEDGEAKSSEGLSRRDFLKLSGAALLSHWFEHSFPEEDKGERLAYWNEIVHRLKKEVWEENRERSYLFAAKAGSGQGVFLQQGEETFVPIPRAKVMEMLAGEPGYIQIIHTHPLSSVYQGEYAHEAKKKLVPAPLAGPSFADIRSAVEIQASAGFAKTTLTDAVADPSGMWEYVADLSHPYARKILELFPQIQQLQQELKKSDDYQRWRQDHAERLQELSPWEVFIAMFDDRAAFAVENQERLERLLELYHELFPENAEAIETATEDLVFPPKTEAGRKEKIETLVRLWQTNGITLRFWSYEELEREIIPPIIQSRP